MANISTHSSTRSFRSQLEVKISKLKNVPHIPVTHSNKDVRKHCPSSSHWLVLEVSESQRCLLGDFSRLPWWLESAKVTKSGNFYWSLGECLCWHQDTLAAQWCENMSTIGAYSELSPVSKHSGGRPHSVAAWRSQSHSTRSTPLGAKWVMCSTLLCHCRWFFLYLLSLFSVSRVRHCLWLWLWHHLGHFLIWGACVSLWHPES